MRQLESARCLSRASHWTLLISCRRSLKQLSYLDGKNWGKSLVYLVYGKSNNFEGLTFQQTSSLFTTWHSDMKSCQLSSTMWISMMPMVTPCSPSMQQVLFTWEAPQMFGRWCQESWLQSVWGPSHEAAYDTRMANSCLGTGLQQG